MSTPTLGPTFVPPEQVGLPPTAAQPVVVEAQVQQQQISAAAVAATAALVAMWATIDVSAPFDWWFGGGSDSPRERAFVTVSAAQEAAASTARDYVLRTLAAQGYPAVVPNIEPMAFTAQSASGQELDDVLEHAVWATWKAKASGKTDAEAVAAGQALLVTIVDTEIDDAAREATSVAQTGARVIDVSPRATEDTDRGREVLTREVIAQTESDREADRVLADLERIMADAALREQIRARAEEEERKAERRARLAADEARRLAERAREQAEADVIAEAERILAEADEREAVREAERIARFAARREARERNKPKTIGWVRVLTPPSCGRCVVLAGRFYLWNQGFERHPHCDCIHLPTTLANHDNYVTDANLAFEAMTPAEQDKAFGVANAEAIRAGANIAQVVNAYSRGSVFTVDGRSYTRAGTTRRGRYRFSAAGQAGALKATPTTLIREAGGDRDEAIRLLTRFGYIVD